jgi:hypothetical protein
MTASTLPAPPAPPGRAPGAALPADRGAPAGSGWAARAVGAADHDAVLAFFTEPDFHFRTPWPDTRPEWELLALLDEDTRLLTLDGEPAGLYAVEENGAAHACHVVLHLRLTAALPPAAWAAAYAEVIRALRWRREVIRLAVVVGSYDERGLAAARLAGFTEEGELPGLVVREARRGGQVFFSRIWEPAS